MKKIISIISLFGFLVTGCTMQNPYIQTNPYIEFKLEQKEAHPLPIHVFVSSEKRKITQQPVTLYAEEAEIYFACNKDLVPSDIKIKTRLMTFFLFAPLALIPYITNYKSLKLKKISKGQISANTILNLDSTKFKVIDDSFKYETKKDFINDMNKIEDNYFIIIDLYEIDNVQRILDKYSNYYASGYYTYTLYASVGVFDIYKSHFKKPRNYFHYQKVFFPERFEKTSISSSVFESFENLNIRRNKTISQDIIKFLNGEKVDGALNKKLSESTSGDASIKVKNNEKTSEEDEIKQSIASDMGLNPNNIEVTMHK